MAEGTVYVKGLKELNDFLQQLEPKLKRNVARKSLRAGAKELLKQAKSMVPVRTGDLRDSLRISTSIKRGNPSASVKAGGPRKGKKNVYYAPMVEFGTYAHVIEAKRVKALYFGGRFYHSVEHPGARGKPFMRTAMASGAAPAVMLTAQSMRDTLSTKLGLDTADITIEEEE